MPHSPNLIRRLLLSAFSRGPSTIRKQIRTNPLGRPLELLEDRVVPAFPGATTVVNSIATKLNVGATTGIETATLNDYTLINNAIQAAQDGDTIVLNGTFDWTKPNAKVSWTLGSDGKASFNVTNTATHVVTPGTGNPLDDADNYSIFVPGDLNSVTLTAAAPVAGKYGALIKGPGDLSTVDSEGFLYFDGGGGTNQGWTISNLDIENFDGAIEMYMNGGPSDVYDNTTITNNKIVVPKDLATTVALPADSGSNVGILLGFGTNQTISNNIILIAGNGTSDANAGVNGNYAETDGIVTTAGGGSVYDNLLITGNSIQVTAASTTKPEIVIGVWENGSANSSDITVSNNSFTNKATPKPLTSLERAFRLTSHSSATTTVTYSNNTVDGANIGFQWLPPSYGADFSGLQPVQLIGNVITRTNTGVLVQSNGSAFLSNNTIGNGTSSSTVPSTGVNVVTGSLTGATQNIITGNSVGIRIQSTAGAIGPINNNNIYNNVANSITTNLTNASAAAVNATGNWWGSSVGTVGVFNVGVGSVDVSTFNANATIALPLTEFDFQKAATDRGQSGSLPVLPTTAYNSTLGYGWTSVPIGFAKVSVTAPLPSPEQFELEDGVSSTILGVTGAKTFRVDLPTAGAVQVTAFLGNGTLAYDGLQVDFSTDGITFGNAITNISVPKAGYVSVSTPAGVLPSAGGTHSLFIRFQDVSGTVKGWAVDGITVTPAPVGALTVTPLAGVGPQRVDAAVDTYVVTGESPFATLTVSATLGTIVTPDAGSNIPGIQIVADQSGTATFQILRPVLAGTSTITATDFTGGASFGTTTQVYTAATPPSVSPPVTPGSVLRFDMNSAVATAGPSLPDNTWNNVTSTTVYSAATGFGWVSKTGLKSLDTLYNFPPGSTLADQNLFRDYVDGTTTATSTFKVSLGAAAAGQTVSVKVYAYSPSPAATVPLGMTVSLDGGVTKQTLTAGQTFLTVTGVADANGDVNLQVAKGTVLATGNKAWVVNGIEVTLT